MSSLLTTTVSRSSSPGPASGGDVHLERRVATLVLGDPGVPDPDDCPVGGGVEPQHHPLTGPPRGTNTCR